MMSLTGLTDDYAHDGRVLIEVMTDGAVPATLQQHRATFGQLASVYKAINAPLGPVGMKSLQDATTAIEGSDGAYIGFRAQLTAFTNQRNSIARHMNQMLEASEFGGVPFNDIAAQLRPGPVAVGPVISTCVNAREGQACRQLIKKPAALWSGWHQTLRRKREPTPRRR
jgi:hypothetical protein